MLNLAQNFFTWKISEGLGNCKKLSFLDLSLNRLSGEIRDKIPVPCMTLFDIMEILCQLMPLALERLGNHGVYAFLAGRNKLIGTFPEAFFEKCDKVRDNC